jgi:hypothetical protein
MIDEITEAWQLDDVLDALPRRLTPNYTKNVMEWGITFIKGLRDLARLTQGRHSEVVAALNWRLEQKYTHIRPSGANWTVMTDIEHLLKINAPRPAGTPPQMNKNVPYRGRTPAVGTRRSNRIANRAANTPTPADYSTDDEHAGSSTTRYRPNVSAGHQAKRGRDAEDDEPVQNNDNVGARKRVRLSPRGQRVHSSQLPFVGEQRAGQVGVQQAVQQSNDRAVQVQGENNTQSVAARKEDTVQPVAAQEEPQVRDVVEDIAEGMDHMAFENRYPLPENATRRQRIGLLQSLRKRNLHLRAAVDPHVCSSRDAEYDYRIQLEEIIKEQEYAQE